MNLMGIRVAHGSVVAELLKWFDSIIVLCLMNHNYYIVIESNCFKSVWTILKKIKINKWNINGPKSNKNRIKTQKTMEKKHKNKKLLKSYQFQLMIN